MEKFAWRKCLEILLKPKLFSKFPHRIFRTFYVKSLPQKICFCLSANHNPEFVLVLHVLHWCYTSTTLLSANQNGVIYMVNIVISEGTMNIMIIALRKLNDVETNYITRLKESAETKIQTSIKTSKQTNKQMNKQTIENLLRWL